MTATLSDLDTVRGEPGTPLVRVRGLRKSFGTHRVLHDVDLDLARGSVTALLGPSGSGKSTLLRCINHLEKPTGGFVEIDGEIIGYRHRGGVLRELRRAQVARQRAKVGMVFQQFNLFGHLTVLENLLEGQLASGIRRDEATERAGQLLDRVGLTGREQAYPSRLSGGQQQRVAIARALALRPALLLFDEPTSALDPELVGEVLAVMRDLAQDGMTMLVVTHELGFAREVADTAVFLDGGRIVEAGAPGVGLTNPTHERARAFLRAVD